MVIFCEKCGSLLIPRQNEKDRTVILYCKLCKRESKEEFIETSYQISIKIPHSEKERLTVIEEEFDIRPNIRITCPRCDYHEARYWEAAD